MGGAAQAFPSFSDYYFRSPSIVFNIRSFFLLGIDLLELDFLGIDSLAFDFLTVVVLIFL
jgi:hypothetical protein